MADLLIDLDDDVIRLPAIHAKSRRISLEDYLREMIIAEAGDSRSDLQTTSEHP